MFIIDTKEINKIILHTIRIFIRQTVKIIFILPIHIQYNTAADPEIWI